MRRQVSEGMQGAGLAAAGVATVVILAFLLALEDQFGRLHAPRTRAFGFARLHGDDPAAAVAAWRRGAAALHEFGAVDPDVLIGVHAAATILLGLVLGTFLVVLIARFELPHWLHGIAVVGAGATVVTGVLELLLTGGDPDGRFSGIFTALRLLGVLGPLAVIVVGGVLRVGDPLKALRLYRRAPATARLMSVAAVVFLGLVQASDIGAQVEDLLRREVGTAHGLALVRIALALAAYLLVVATVRLIAVEPGTAPEAGRLVAYGAGALVVGSIVLVVGNGGSSPVVLGTIVLAVGVTSWIVGPRPPGETDGSDESDESDATGRWLYVVAGIAPPVGLAMVTSRLLAGEIATRGAWPVLVVVDVALVATTVVAGWAFTRPVAVPDTAAAPPSRRQRVERIGWGPTAFLAAVATAPLLLAVGQLASDRTSVVAGRVLGSLAVVVVMLAAFGATGGLARLLAADWERPAIFARWSVPLRTPVVSLLLVWFLGVVLVGARYEDARSSPHVVRFVDAPAGEGDEATSAPETCPDDVAAALAPVPPRQQGVADALCTWLVHNAVQEDRTRAPVPLVLATASGGGVRAAAWTVRVLDCLLLAAPAGDDPCGDGRVVSDDGPDAWPLLFAANGASGGSVGLASAVAERIAPITPIAGESDSDWVRELGGPDHVGPVLAHMTLVELALAPFGLAPGHDRAEVLVDGWADPFDDIGPACPALAGEALAEVGFAAVAAACPDVPLLMFNGTVVRTGQRFDISPVRVPTPATSSTRRAPVELVDVLCPGDDLRYFDAAFLSARFPLVTPSGRLPAAGDGCDRPVPSGVDVVDGGYLENHGAAQLADLWAALRPLLRRYGEARPDGYRAVQPVVLRIDNGERRGEPRLIELIDTATDGGDEPAPDETADQPDVDQSRTRLASGFGEPLRIPQALLAVQRQGTRPNAMDELLAQLRRDDVPVLHLALYSHPGRRLPLGWALSGGILDDIDRVFRLCPNQLAAADLRALLAGDPDHPDAIAACPRPD